MARQHGVHAFAQQHVGRFAQAVHEVGVGRVGPVARLVHLDDLVPGPEAARQLGGLAGLDGLGRERVEAHARRQHQALLRAADGDVHTPLVVAIVGTGQARDGVDQQQGRVLGRVDGLAHGGDIARCTGRGFVVHHTHGLDGVARVGFEALLDQISLHTPAPAGGHTVVRAWVGDDLGLEPQARGQAVPEKGEVAGLVHQHVVAGAQGVAQRGFPGARARGRVNDDRVLGLEDLLDVGQHLETERAELGATVVDGGQAHGAQHALGHGGGARDLQEMAAGGVEVGSQHGSTTDKDRWIFCIQKLFVKQKDPKIA